VAPWVCTVWLGEDTCPGGSAASSQRRPRWKFMGKEPERGARLHKKLLRIDSSIQSINRRLSLGGGGAPHRPRWPRGPRLQPGPARAQVVPGPGAGALSSCTLGVPGKDRALRFGFEFCLQVGDSVVVTCTPPSWPQSRSLWVPMRHLPAQPVPHLTPSPAPRSVPQLVLLLTHTVSWFFAVIQQTFLRPSWVWPCPGPQGAWMVCSGGTQCVTETEGDRKMRCTGGGLSGDTEQAGRSWTVCKGPEGPEPGVPSQHSRTGVGI
jgi:hypothetical protein